MIPQQPDCCPGGTAAKKRETGHTYRSSQSRERPSDSDTYQENWVCAVPALTARPSRHFSSIRLRMAFTDSHTYHSQMGRVVDTPGSFRSRFAGSRAREIVSEEVPPQGSRFVIPLSWEPLGVPKHGSMKHANIYDNNIMECLVETADLSRVQ